MNGFNGSYQARSDLCLIQNMQKKVKTLETDKLIQGCELLQ